MRNRSSASRELASSPINSLLRFARSFKRDYYSWIHDVRARASGILDCIFTSVSNYTRLFSVSQRDLIYNDNNESNSRRERRTERTTRELNSHLGDIEDVRDSSPGVAAGGAETGRPAVALFYGFSRQCSRRPFPFVKALPYGPYAYPGPIVCGERTRCAARRGATLSTRTLLYPRIKTGPRRESAAEISFRNSLRARVAGPARTSGPAARRPA